MIYEVGRWALQKALGDYLRWRAAGLPVVRIAVNVSPLQLRHRGFIDEIKQTMSLLGRVKLFVHGGKQAFAIDVDACHGCGLCVEVCPESAIKLQRRQA